MSEEQKSKISKCNWCILCALLISMGSAVAAEAPSGATLTTNYNSRFNIQGIPRDIALPIHQYDVGYVIYSRSFAGRFGYPQQYIANLDPGMEALEFRMVSQGGEVACYLNTLLDNNLGLDLPPEDYAERFERNGDMIRFPQKINSFKDSSGFMGYRESPEDKKFRMEVTQDKAYYYGMNLRLAAYDYVPQKKQGWATSLFLKSYTNKYIKNLDYMSISITCGESSYTFLKRPNASLWFKKKGGDDYTLKMTDKPEQFIKLHIPAAFAQKSAEQMKPVMKFLIFPYLPKPSSK